MQSRSKWILVFSRAVLLLGVLFSPLAYAAAPVTINATTSTTEDTAITVDLTAYASDADGHALTYYKGASYYGTVDVTTAGQATFTPAANYTGTSASFTFYVRDTTSATSNTSRISVSITAVNDTPTAGAVPITTYEDTIKTITMAGSDAETAATSLTYAIVSSPTKGTLGTISGRNVVYTPTRNISGTDSFTYTASDGSATSSVATVSITVTAVNDRPIARAVPVTVIEDTPKTITLLGADVETASTSLTYAIVTSPTKGSLGTISGRSVTYTPNTNSTAADSFTYTASDGLLTSTAGTVTITMTAVNDAPTVTNTTASTTEDTAVSITLLGDDVDGDSLTYTVTTPSGFLGSVSEPSGATVVFTPTENYHDTEFFTYTATDTSGIVSAAATVSLEVTSDNDAPVATGTSQDLNEDEETLITLSATDEDGDTLTYEASDPPHGEVTAISGNVATYVPDDDYNGTDSFTFTASDGTEASAAATVDLMITEVNDAPTAAAVPVSALEETLQTITLSGSDVDGDALTYAIVTNPTRGTLGTLSGASIPYTGSQDLFGDDSFTYKVTDAKGLESAEATVSVAVTNVNDRPSISNVTGSTDCLEPATVALLGTDPDSSDTLTYRIAIPPSATKGTAVISNADGVADPTGAYVTVTPNTSYCDNVLFYYSVSDGVLSASSNKTVNITVYQSPVASDVPVSTNEDTAVDITLSATDADGDSLTYEIVTNPTQGTLGTLSGRTVRYTPNENSSEDDSFTYRAYETATTTSISNTATVTIVVDAVNDVPTVSDISASTDQGVAVTLPLVASDVEESELSYTFSTPTGGVVARDAASGVTTYTPTSSYYGTDEFTCTVSDGTDSATANISVVVTPENETPVAVAQSVTVNEDETVTITLSATDNDGDTLTYGLASFPTHGTYSLSGDQFIYEPDDNYNGTDEITFQAHDGVNYSAAATVSITVTPDNDPPTSPVSVSVTEDENYPDNEIDLSATDTDGDTVTYSSCTDGAHGDYYYFSTLGRHTFTPDENYFGSDTFTCEASDGTATVTVTVNVDVVAVNDVPTLNSDHAYIAEGEQVQFTLSTSDVEDVDPTITLSAEPTLGSASLSDTTVTYVSNGTAGTDTFTYTASDSAGSSASGVFTVYIGAENEPPTVSAVTGSGAEESEITLTLLGEDADGDDLTYLVSASEDGTSEIDGETLRFTPAASFNGTATLAYYANDGQESSDAGTVTITVSGDNDAPVASDLEQTLSEDMTTTIALTADDPEGETLTYQEYGSPMHGTIVIDGDSAVYDPEDDFYGSDSFTFTATDATGAVSNVATVSLTVRSVPDPTVTCSLSYDSSHVQYDATNDVYFTDNLLLVRFDHVATSAELDAVDALLTTEVDSAEVVCRIEQDQLSADEITESGFTLNPDDSDYGHYAFEITAQSDLDSLDTLAQTLVDGGYAAMPFLLDGYELLAAATDVEATFLSSSQSMPSAYKMIQLQGAWEYMSAYELQGHPLHSVAASVVDSGVCADASLSGNCGGPRRTVVIDPAITSEFTDMASSDLASDDVFVASSSLIDSDPGYHGTNVAYVIAGASNGITAGISGLDAHLDYGNGLLGGVTNFTETNRFMLYSYNVFWLRNMYLNFYSDSMTATDMNDALVKAVGRSFGDACAHDVVNVSIGYNANGNRNSRLQTAAQIGEAAASCQALFVVAAGNQAINLTSDTSAGAEQIYSSFGDDVLIVQGTEDNSLATSTWGTTSGSNSGGRVNIAAPLEYTSYATPLVTGTAVLLKAIDSSLSRSDLVSLITQAGQSAASGAPFLDVTSSALLAIEDEGDLVPMTITETKYTASPALSVLRNSEGFSNGNHTETGWWRRDSNSSDTLQIYRFSTESSNEGLASVATIDPAGYYDWSMQSNYYSDERYKVGVAEISDSGRRVPVQVVQPSGAQSHILSGKYHAYHYERDNASVSYLSLEDHAEAHCLTLSYNVNASENLASGGIHVPLGRDSVSAAHTVPYKVTDATLTGNIVKKSQLYWDPEQTWNEDLSDDSSDSGDETGYASLEIPDCDGDITSAYSVNEGAFEAWVDGVENTEYDVGTTSSGDWMCTQTAVTTVTHNVCPSGSGTTGYYWCDGRMQCTNSYFDPYPWAVVECTGDPEPTETSSTEERTYEAGSCDADDAATSSTTTSGNTVTTTSCRCENIVPQTLTANCAVNSIWDSGSPYAPEEVDTYMHLSAELTGLENCQLSVAEAHESLTSGDVQNPSTGEWHDSFSYSQTSGSASCTATAAITMTTAYVREYVTGEDECSLGSMERIGKQTDSFSVQVTWDMAQGEFPAKDIFTDIAAQLPDLMGTYTDWLEDAAGDLQEESYDSSLSPFTLAATSEILFMPDALVNTRQVTPGFGLEMIDVQWSHGLGPVKRHGETSDGLNFTWSASTRPSRSVGQ